MQLTLELDGVPIAKFTDPQAMPCGWTSWQIMPLSDDPELRSEMLTSKFFAANDNALVLANEKNERFKPAIPPFFPVSENGRILLHTSRQVMRGYFQIHLSTAVVLMLVLSGFVALNFRPQYDEKYDPGTGRKSRLVSRGWPVSFLTRRDWQDPVSQQWVSYVAQSMSSLQKSIQTSSSTFLSLGSQR
jgi:hypothetical protein